MHFRRSILNGSCGKLALEKLNTNRTMSKRASSSGNSSSSKRSRSSGGHKEGWDPSFAISDHDRLVDTRKAGTRHLPSAIYGLYLWKIETNQVK